MFPTAFLVDGQWYETTYNIVKLAQRAVGPEWDNAKIVAWLEANGGYRFTPAANFIFITAKGG